MTNNPQDTAEWHQARIGHVTASRMGVVVRRKGDSKPYAGYEDYINEIVLERLTNRAADHFVSEAMQHGTDTEDEAAAYYMMETGRAVTRTGFVRHPSIEWLGASPDRLVGDDGLLEIKCPTIKTHLDTILGAKIKPEYHWQMVAQMICTGREWCDFMSYDNRMPPHLRSKIVRVERCADDVKDAEERTKEFLARADERKAQLDALNPAQQAAA